MDWGLENSIGSYQYGWYYKTMSSFLEIHTEHWNLEGKECNVYNLNGSEK